MNKTIEQLLNTEQGVGLCWLGNDGWLLGARGHLFATDLDLCSDERIAPPPISLEEVAGPLEFLMVTHNHGDHLNGGTCRFLAAHSRCRFVLPESCRELAAEYGVPLERILWVAPGNGYDLAPWLRVETVRALHGHIKHSIYEYANLMDCGYLMHCNGRTLFQPGDTVLLHQHLDMDPVDVLFVSPTEHNTHIEGSRTLIESLTPERIIAQHFGTYHVTERNRFWAQGYPEELRAELPKEFQARFLHPTQGNLIRI